MTPISSSTKEMDSETDTKTDTQVVTLGIEWEVFAVPVESVVETLDMRRMFRLPEASP